MLLGWLCAVLVAWPPILIAQTNADCLACHSDATLTKDQGGKAVSLHVDDAVLGKSPHKKLVCVACHTGFSAEDIPHNLEYFFFGYSVHRIASIRA